MAKAAPKVVPAALRRGGRGGMAAGLMAARAADQGHQMMGVGEIARNPENPGRLDDLEGLTESIKEVGVLQPLLVCSRAAYLADRDGTGVGPGDWVLLAGERRLAAAQAAQVAEVPVVVRDDLAKPGMSHAVVSAENGLREGLSPMQEAEQYHAMVEAGLSQRRVAALVGRSSGHITKRLKLLQVPERARVGLGESIEIGAALALAEVEPALQDDVLSLAEEENQRWPGGPVSSQDIIRAADRVTRDRVGEEKMVAATAEGARAVTQVTWHQQIHTDREIAAARKADALIVARNPGSSELTYGDARRPATTSTSDQDKERRDQMKQRRAGTQRWIADHLAEFQTSENRTTAFARWIVDGLHHDLGVEIWKAVRGHGVGPAYDAGAYTPEDRRMNKPYHDWREALSDAEVVTVAALAPILSDLRASEYGHADSPALVRTNTRIASLGATASTEAPQSEGEQQ